MIFLFDSIAKYLKYHWTNHKRSNFLSYFTQTQNNEPFPLDKKITGQRQDVVLKYVD